jgi:hypothetical protein
MEESDLSQIVRSWLRPAGRRDCPHCPNGTLMFDGTCDVCGKVTPREKEED